MVRFMKEGVGVEKDNIHMVNSRKSLLSWYKYEYYFLIVDSAETSYNSQAIGLCLIGKFTKKTPKALQWNATVLFIENALTSNQLSGDYKIFHQTQLIGGVDENNNLYKATKMLKNWKRSKY